MSLQFRSVAVLLLATFEFACISISPQSAATAAAISATAPLADVVGDTRVLDQPSNAARLDALQRLLKRGLAFALQPFANNARQRDGREHPWRPSRSAIHSPEDTADKLGAEGMTLISQQPTSNSQSFELPHGLGRWELGLGVDLYSLSC